MEEFYVTLIISSTKQDKTIKFLVEADSFAEAVERIKTALDIE